MAESFVWHSPLGAGNVRVKARAESGSRLSIKVDRGKARFFDPHTARIQTAAIHLTTLITNGSRPMSRDTLPERPCLREIVHEGIPA
jgi:hypothetical protein